MNKKRILSRLFTCMLALAMMLTFTAIKSAAAETTTTNPKLKTVMILATGGTIAGSGQAGQVNNYTIGSVDVQALIKGVPGIEKLANLVGIQICNVGSDDMNAERWLTLTKTIDKYANDDSIAGFVITHGTDTLDETAYWLNLTVKTNKPVVIVGAMRPSTATSADGPMNLYQAVALAANPNAVGRGVMAVFSDGIYGARDVVKVSTFRPDAFNGRDLGCLGYMLNDTPYFYNATVKKHTTATEFNVDNLTVLPKVSIAYFYVDADPGILDYMVKNSEGIVIAGAGAGCMSELWTKKIAALEGRGFPVVRCSRVSNGIITYDSYFDQYTNVILGDNLAPQKAKILLQLALTRTRNIKQIKEMFITY